MKKQRKNREIIFWKFFLFYLLTLILVLNILPALLVGGWWRQEEKYEGEQLHRDDEKGEITEKEIELDIYHVEKGEIINMELEEYIVRVVVGEVPASFEPQALKAQAVAARTYALNKALDEDLNCNYHEEADLCTDYKCCQEFKELERALSKWPPDEQEENLERVKEAVHSTAGKVLTYGDSLINSLYHSTCGGKTEDAHAVWSGRRHPYLVSVECDYCQHSSHYEREVAVELAAFASSINNEHGIVLLREDNTPDLEVKERSESGRNSLVRLGGETYSGNEIRELLDLPSTNFTWRVEADTLVFETRGFGHGVGLCQYGADGMAQEGKDFTEILKHFYTGVEINPIGDTMK